MLELNQGNLCGCGCGLYTKHPKSKYVHGHHLKIMNKNSEFQKKQIDGMVQKHGVTHSLKSDTSKEKYKTTCLKNLGVEHPSQSELVKEKKKQASIDRYGVENISQSDIIKEKKIETNIKNNKVKYPLQSIEIQNRSRITCLERYGVETSFESKEVRDIFKKNFLKKHGVENPFQLDSVKETILVKSKETCLKKYGVDNWAKTQSAKHFHRNQAIQFVENQRLNGETLCPRIGNDERLFLDSLQDIISYHIHRNNKLYGFFPDGLIEELRLIIEFDERFHFIDKWGTYRSSDIERDLFLASQGYIIHRIKQKDWEENPDSIKNQFISLIESIQNS